MCQSHTGRLTGLWFLPEAAFGLNTNDDEDAVCEGNIMKSLLPLCDISQKKLQFAKCLLREVTYK